LAVVLFREFAKRHFSKELIMRANGYVIALAVGAFLAAPAAGQSFNLDSDTGVVGNTAMGAPAATFAGAAAQPGTWNAITGNVLLSMPLVNLNGSPSSAVVTRQASAGGNFASDNANTTRDFQLLLDDGYDLSAAPAGFISFTFSGLQNGTYEVYTYAIAPDVPEVDFTIVRIGTDTTTQQTCGGPMPVNSFTLGITHTKHTVVVTTGTIVVQADGAAGSFGTINGFQLKLLPAAACLGNTNGDSQVDVNDLLAVITTWGACPPPPAPCLGDIAPPGPPAGDGQVDVNDLLLVISHWGPCP